MNLRRSITKRTDRAAVARRRAALDRMNANEPLMRQHNASRASFERGEPTIPGPQVRTEAAERERRGTL